ncbi:metalloregulator ArsR/SmtB family transcription factor [Actinoplanes sp. NBC_00393]|uniref:ArsR/SmtB family transcription factor n=1 Tax=Actinoplanes sp. NBC_00393 TaxID=2975953 RepID=UPI002E2439AA
MSALHSPFAAAHRFTPADAEQLAAALRVVADPARLRILALLAEHGALTVTALVPLLGLAQATVSHHLRALHTADLIQARKTGSEIERTLNALAIERLAGLLSPYGSRR